MMLKQRLLLHASDGLFRVQNKWCNLNNSNASNEKLTDLQVMIKSSKYYSIYGANVNVEESDVTIAHHVAAIHRHQPSTLF